MAKITAQFFIKNNQRIPFSQFLRDEKKSRGCSWKELDKICGVNRINSYVLAETKSEPNRPPHDKFLQMIQALGYSENDFEVKIEISSKQRAPVLSKEEYEKKIANAGRAYITDNARQFKKRHEPTKALSTYH